MNDIISRTGIDEALARGRILVLDGAMGTMLQRLDLGEDDFSRGLPSAPGRGLKGDNECLYDNTLRRKMKDERLNVPFCDAIYSILPRKSPSISL